MDATEKAVTRHSSFPDPYRVRTWRDGTETTYEVRRGTTQPFDITEIGSRTGIAGHGTEILATASEGVSLDAETAREVIGTRFLGTQTSKCQSMESS